MKSASRWCMFCLSVTLGSVMVGFGALLIRGMCVSFLMGQGDGVFCSFLLGVLLLLAGGGVLSSTIARSLRRGLR